MHEQRPPTSPGAHAAGQPQRPGPASPQAPHAAQPLRPPPHLPHGPQPVRPLQAHPPAAVHPAAPRPVVRPAPPQPARPLPVEADDELVVLDDEPVLLEDEGDVTAPAPVAPVAGSVGAARSSLAVDGTPSKKITFGAELQHRKRDWKRVPHNSGHGACRVKTFHAKLSDQGLEYLDDAINVFLDEHPEVDVKFVEQTIGMFDGKFKDFALIVSVWY